MGSIRNTSRREFLSAGAALLATSACSTATTNASSLEARVEATVRAFDAQGDHRTATQGDLVAADWLAAEARRAGAQVTLESFELSRVDPRAAYARIAGRRIEGVPFFDTRFTDDRGVAGRLGPLGSDAEIGVVQAEQSGLTDTARPVMPEVRRSRHQAVIFITRGKLPGLFLGNAGRFTTPEGPPTLQVANTEAAWLLEQARRGTEATLVAAVDRTPAKAANVVAWIEGSDAGAAPIVVSTPRSGWWRCAAERGGGIACWLETVRAVALAKPRRTCHFAAFSGHELSWLGGQDFLRRHPGLVEQAPLWLHFGANIGAPGQPNLLNAHDDALEQWAAAAMERQGIAVDRRASRGATPFGEAALVQRRGGRYVALVCDNDYFHHPGDRWPDAVDVPTLARYARAFAFATAAAAQA